MSKVSSPTELDAEVADLARNKAKWASLPIARKIEYLDALVRKTTTHAADWVERSVAGKHLNPESPWVGEEWISGPYATLVGMAAHLDTLRALDRGADVLAGRTVRVVDGRVVVDVFPMSAYDRLLLNGYRAEVWMQPRVTPANLRTYVAGTYTRGDDEGAVGLILGAGNISSIPMLDLLTKMFAAGQVVVVKLNPVNDYLGPIFEAICEELMADGYVRFVYGGGSVGSYLVGHDDVDALHITGSEETYNAIVFGTGDEGMARRRADDPLVTKPFTSELGGVGPTIVVPGPWKDADFAFQAEHLATQKNHNAGFNCIASQVLVLPGSWDSSDRLVSQLRRTLSTLPARAPYYPDADKRRAAASAAYPDSEVVGGTTLITGVPAQPNEYAYTTEFFGSVYATTRLDATSTEDYLDDAVAFANSHLDGTLGAQLLIHPETAKAHGLALERAIANLRYGSIGVNSWTGVGYLLPTATWGAYPGHHRADIGSGTGVVHNALMFDAPEKTVVYAPFAPFPRSIRSGELHLSPKPPWFVTHQNAARVGRLLTEFAGSPSWPRLLNIAAASLRHS